MKRSQLYAAIAATITAMAAAAAAGTTHENDALAIAKASISLTQAVAAAEKHVGGKALQAEFERHKGQWMFDVEVVKDGKVMDVKVDATTGKVLSATEDAADDEKDENDAED